MRTLKIQGRGLNSASVIALTAVAALGLASAAQAQDDKTSAGGEGVTVTSVIVRAERSKAAELAPTKASIEETQPESIISHHFIEQVTPEVGTWVSAASIAPSISGVTSNGVGETSKLTMRGFQDGQFNLTYDGIAFGDTNGPTHHEASYWPASTIGAVVIDRGPGAAGDLGQANFGGAIHFYSPEVSNTFGMSQKVTYGSFATWQGVTTINTGAISQLGGAKLLLNFDELSSAGELSNSSGEAQNQLAKLIVPLGSSAQLTLFSSHNYTHFYQNDGSGPGATWAQIQTYGKNFALTNTPTDEHYYGDNYEGKHTDFDYIDLKDNLTPASSVEDQFYTYFYSNKTISASSNTDQVGLNTSDLVGSSADKGGETGQSANDLQGYHKLNQYRVYGDVVRLNQDWSFGTLKVGGLVEWSNTKRYNLIRDITNGWTPLYSITAATVANGPTTKNLTPNKLLEDSDWQDYQAFVDFNWRPLTGLTISPGFKYVDEHLAENAADEKVSVPTSVNSKGSITEPYTASNDYSSPLYFLTANYKIKPYWSVYGQVATSFVFPFLGELDFSGAQVKTLQPEKTISYQTGTVYSRGNFTADADIYEVDASNLEINCTIADGGGAPEAAQCNAGKARYNGVEGEAAYHLDQGITLFVNGGSNVSKQLAQGANVAAGIQGNPAQELPNAPRWTAAIGAIVDHGPWEGSITYKQSGTYVVYNTSLNLTTNPALPAVNPRFSFPGYDSIDASIAYDFGHFKVKLQGFNLADSRAITGFTPSSGATKASLYNTNDTSYYQFQEGRDLQLTLEAKF